MLCFLVLFHLWIFIIPVFLLYMVIMSFFVCWVHLVILILGNTDTVILITSQAVLPQIYGRVLRANLSRSVKD